MWCLIFFLLIFMFSVCLNNFSQTANSPAVWMIPLLSSSERLVGAVHSRVSNPGGGAVHRQPALRCTFHVQPRTSGQPVSVPLPQPWFLHGHQQPALHPALPGRCPLPLVNFQPLPAPFHLLPLPPLHEQSHQWPDVQNGERGGVWQSSPRQRGSFLLA